MGWSKTHEDNNEIWIENNRDRKLLYADSSVTGDEQKSSQPIKKAFVDPLSYNEQTSPFIISKIICGLGELHQDTLSKLKKAISDFNLSSQNCDYVETEKCRTQIRTKQRDLNTHISTRQC